uniref:Uncharacterized protein n=1 Tax=Cajanus cajan TaxID=3821 RepID=A0A151UER3_CAJCA
MTRAPWMIFDHYLMDKTIIWVRFPRLGLMYYNESVLLTIAPTIGRPIKVDLNMLNI